MGRGNVFGLALNSVVYSRTFKNNQSACCWEKKQIEIDTTAFHVEPWPWVEGQSVGVLAGVTSRPVPPFGRGTSVVTK